MKETGSTLYFFRILRYLTLFGGFPLKISISSDGFFHFERSRNAAVWTVVSSTLCILLAGGAFALTAYHSHMSFDNIL